MRELTALEYSFIIKEMKRLEGRHFSNIYNLGGGVYRIKIGTGNVIVQPGIRMHLTKYIRESEAADGFAQKVKKELKNKRLLEILQLNNDRIVEMRFDGVSLFFEMFGKGNIILVKDGKTLAALHYRKWSGREIARGKEYYPPPSEVKKTLEETLTDRYVIHSLMKLQLGKQYAKELLVRCCIDEKKSGNELDEKERGCLETEMKEMLDRAKPKVYYGTEGESVEFGLSDFSSASGYKAREFPALNEAADEYYFHFKEGESPQVERIRKRLEKQEERMRELTEMEREFRERGDFIYSNKARVAEILEKLKNIKPDRIEFKFPKQRAKVNKKEKSVEIDI